LTFLIINRFGIIFIRIYTAIIAPKYANMQHPPCVQCGTKSSTEKAIILKENVDYIFRFSGVLPRRRTGKLFK